MSRTHMLVGTVGVAVLLAGSAVKAQAQELRANIPFEFSTADKMLPAGTYWIERLFGSPGAVQLRSLHGGVILLTGPASTDRSTAGPQLTFHRYGDRYFLRQIRFSGSREYTVPPTLAERELARARADGRAPAPAIVTVVPER